MQMENDKNSMLAPEERAKDLLGRMTVREKLKQLCCVFPVPGSEGADAVKEINRRSIEDNDGMGTNIDEKMYRDLH